MPLIVARNTAIIKQLSNHPQMYYISEDSALSLIVQLSKLHSGKCTRCVPECYTSVVSRTPATVTTLPAATVVHAAQH